MVCVPQSSESDDIIVSQRLTPCPCHLKDRIRRLVIITNNNGKISLSIDLRTFGDIFFPFNHQMLNTESNKTCKAAKGHMTYITYTRSIVIKPR